MTAQTVERRVGLFERLFPKQSEKVGHTTPLQRVERALPLSERDIAMLFSRGSELRVTELEKPPIPPVRDAQHDTVPNTPMEATQWENVVASGTIIATVFHPLAPLATYAEGFDGYPPDTSDYVPRLPRAATIFEEASA